MNTFRFSVAGSFSLADISDHLSLQEAKNTEFLDSKVAYLNGEVVNLVTFNLYDDATLPTELILKKKSETPPPNATQFWEGVMAADNALVVVAAYRAK